MDSYTLTLVVIIFLVSLGLYLVTTTQVVSLPPSPLPEKPTCADKLELLDIKIPPVLRQNVAVARFVRMYK